MIVQEESGEGDGDRGSPSGPAGQEGQYRELQGSRESIGKDGHRGTPSASTAGNQG